MAVVTSRGAIYYYVHPLYVTEEVLVPIAIAEVWQMTKELHQPFDRNNLAVIINTNKQ